MGERNTVCTSPNVDMEIDQQGQDRLHPEPCFYLGNNGHYTHPNVYPVLSASGSANLRHFANTRDTTSTVCTSQNVDMEIDQQGQDRLHPEPCSYLGNNGHYTHPNVYPVLSASGNANLRHFANTRDTTVFYGSQFNGLHHNPITNMDLSAFSSFQNPCMVPPPSGSGAFSAPRVSADQLPSSSRHGAVGAGMSEFGANPHLMDDIRSSSKRKNVGVSSSNSSSSHLGMLPPNTGMAQAEEQVESRVLDVAGTIPEYGVSGVVPTTGGRAGRSARSRSHNIGLQMDSPMIHSTNYLVHGNYMGQSFQPATWVEQQFGSTGNDGSTPTWSYAPAVPYLNGGNVHGVPSEVASMSGQGYSDTMNRNSTVIFSPPMHHHHHFHPSPAMQAMPVHSSYHHQQPLPPSFGQAPGNNLHHGTTNHSLDDSELSSRHPRQFPSNGLRVYRPHRSGAHQTVPVERNRPYLRYLSEDEVAILEFPGFYEVETSGDRHRDMRLDIDDMSYEELLALGERIGTVITGLPEEAVESRLKTRVYTSPTTVDNSQEESCIVCQVEYRNQEKIGTLDCGHEYHADCIKRWLQVKNVCPICKVSAISKEDGRKTK